MAKINKAATGHGSRSEAYGGGLVIQYNVFPSGTAAERARLTKVTEAYGIVNRLDRRIDLHGPCNRYFRNLPHGNSFRHYWRDDTIFIDFSPSMTSGFFGATHTNDKDITVSAWCLNKHNRWMIAATIVHEFAHIAGAPGVPSHNAERAVQQCGFGPQYASTILGSIRELGRHLERLA